MLLNSFVAASVLSALLKPRMIPRLTLENSGVARKTERGCSKMKKATVLKELGKIMSGLSGSLLVA